MSSEYHWVYIVECENGSYYTGSAVNIVRRYWQHLNGSSGAKYIAAFKPKKLACCWQIFGTRGDSLRLEAYIKKRGRIFKENLIVSPHILQAIAKDEYGLEVFPFCVTSIEEHAALYTKSDLAKNFDPLRVLKC